MSDTAVAEPTSDADGLDTPAYDYPVDVSDAGPAAKKVSVTIPRDRIDAHTEEVFGSLGSEAALPGFRRGKAPKHLLRKKFAKGVRDQVQQDLLRESYQHALSSSELRPLGDPEFGDEKVELPEQGDLVYSFTVEVRPDLTLPPMEHLTVKKPKIVIKDEHVDQAMINLQNQQGALMPVEDRGVEDGDYLTAKVTVRDGETVVAEQENAQLVARSGRIAGILVDDFAEKVKGLKPTESRSFDVVVPDDHAAEQMRGKTLAVTVELADLRLLKPAEIDGPFLESLGFENNDELREALREQMVERVEADVQNAMRRQVQKYLLDNVDVILPEKLGEKQTQRVVSRRAMDLLQRGVPEEKVRAAVDRLREGADAEGKRELASFFILDKAAEEHEIQIDESEINGQVAQLAIERDMRPETLFKKMSEDGSLQNLAMAMRERKVLDKLMEQAKVEEVEPTKEETQDAVAQATGEAEADEEDVT
jgi:trigger factor